MSTSQVPSCRWTRALDKNVASLYFSVVNLDFLTGKGTLDQTFSLCGKCNDYTWVIVWFV